jgi:Secretion system C-terminal sorting domain
MKRKAVVYLFAAAICTIVLSSNKGGPGIYSQWDGTGAESGLGNTAGCSYSGGCHSPNATSGIAVVIELDSAGVSTTHYTGGMNYTVKLSGTNNTGIMLPAYGFQIGSIKGTSTIVTPTNTGTWTSPYPAGNHFSSPVANGFVVGMVEHSSTQSPTTGTGGNGTIYSKTFTWTAPTSGTGTISIWAVINAVNNNTQADIGDLWNTNHIAISEWGNSSSGISTIESNQLSLNVYPNPVSTFLNLNYTLSESSKVIIQLFDMEGKVVSELLNETQNSGLQNRNISIPTQLRDGIYILKTSLNDQQYLKKISVNR